MMNGIVLIQGGVVTSLLNKLMKAKGNKKHTQKKGKQYRNQLNATEESDDFTTHDTLPLVWEDDVNDERRRGCDSGGDDRERSQDDDRTREGDP